MRIEPDLVPVEVAVGRRWPRVLTGADQVAVGSSTWSGGGDIPGATISFGYASSLRASIKNRNNLGLPFTSLQIRGLKGGFMSKTNDFEDRKHRLTEYLQEHHPYVELLL
ncbi:MAG: hypothetical protein BYD32DRAFT_458227 [Podila humilis]|nr:MAG: hypothetical protein BYD32DRAFT_458227 [Podila humilis]